MRAKAKLRTRVGDRVIGVEGPAEIADSGNVMLTPETIEELKRTMVANIMPTAGAADSLYVNFMDTNLDTATTGITRVVEANPWLGGVNYSIGTDTASNTVYIRNEIFNNPITIETAGTNAQFDFYNCHFQTNAATAFQVTDFGIRNTIYYPTVDTNTASNVIWAPSEETKKSRLRRKFRDQMQPDLTKMFGHAPRALRDSGCWERAAPNELVALGLLKSMVSEEVWRRYLKYKFVTVNAPSGLTYKIPRNSYFIEVMDRGVKLATLCVVLKDRNHIPSTDEIVAKMLICECDEADIWMRSNVRWAEDGCRAHPAVVGLGVQNKGYGKDERIVYQGHPRQNGGINIADNNFVVQADNFQLVGAA